MTWKVATAILQAGQLSHPKARQFIRHTVSDRTTFSITHTILVIKFHSISYKQSVPLIYTPFLYTHEAATNCTLRTHWNGTLKDQFLVTLMTPF